jgi:hypothetical protein
MWHLVRGCQQDCQGIHEQTMKNSWVSTTGLQHVNSFLRQPSAKRAKEELKVKRVIFAGWYLLKGHLFKFGLNNCSSA